MNTWDPLAKTSEQKVLSQEEQVGSGKFLPGSLGLGWPLWFGFGRVFFGFVGVGLIMKHLYFQLFSVIYGYTEHLYLE